MEVKEIEVTKTEKIYELTESEYNELINSSREYGSTKNKRLYNFLLQQFHI